jgi:hypothetical protein
VLNVAGEVIVVSSAIDILSMTDFDDMNDQNTILDRIQNAVLALSNTVSLTTGQLLRSRRARVISKGFDTLDDPSPIGFRSNSFKFFTCRLLDTEAISRHVVSGP